MKVFAALVFSLSIILSEHTFAFAQSASEIEGLLRQSKLVETKRPINVTSGPGILQISTYCDTRAGDRDLKITSLLMMKEIALKFPSIKKLSVSFYDEANIRNYRTVVVGQEHSRLVDSGRAPSDVLSNIPVVAGYRADSAAQGVSVRPGFLYAERQSLKRAIDRLTVKGREAGRAGAAFARLEKACTQSRPDPNQCGILYNDAVVALENEKADKSDRAKQRKEKKASDTARLADSIRKYKNEIDGLAPVLGPGGLDSLIRDIEKDVRSSK